MDRSDIQRAIIAAGMEAHLPPLMEMILPAIDLLDSGHRGTAIPTGGSKRYGNPDLPPDFLWPDDTNGQPMEFVLQLNLEEVAPFDEENLLPKTGLLSFFLSGDGEGDSVLGESGAFYFPEQGGLLPRESNTCEQAIGLRFQRCWSAPQWGTYSGRKLEFLGGQEWPSSLAELQFGGTQLLGHPNDYQGELEPLCEEIFTGRPLSELSPDERRQTYRDWVCLFKESEFSGGVFTHNWLIRREHLAIADFSQVIRIDVN